MALPLNLESDFVFMGLTAFWHALLQIFEPLSVYPPSPAPFTRTSGKKTSSLRTPLFYFSVIFPFLLVSSPFDSWDWFLTLVGATASYSSGAFELATSHF